MLRLESLFLNLLMDLIVVVQGLDDYEGTAEELRFVKVVAQGLMVVRQSNTVSLGVAKDTGHQVNGIAHRKVTSK